MGQRVDRFFKKGLNPVEYRCNYGLQDMADVEKVTHPKADDLEELWTKNFLNFELIEFLILNNYQ
jgi:hypothetical protein